VGISPANPLVCLNGSVTITASGGSVYSWSPALGLDRTDVAGPIASPLVNTTYKVTVSNDIGCQATDSVTIQVVQPEKVSVSPDSAAICPGDTIGLKAQGTDVYNWIGNTVGLSGVQTANPIARPDTTTHYLVVGSDAHGCFADTAAVTVTVLPAPTVDAGPDVEVLAGTPVTLNASGSADVVKWEWSPADYLSCVDCQDPVCTPKASEVYQLTVTGADGCTASDTMQVKLLCEESRVAIPDAFTPNGDGHNDRFVILGIGEVDHLVIFDRWGNKVYERDHFYTSDPDAGWDGNYRGQPAPTGVYVYLAQLRCPAGGEFTRKGTVVLVR
jgi:gliding motility-associated-like protein